jgi:hypothetical protein
VAADVTRIAVRRNAVAYVVATVATSVAVVLGAGTLQVVVVAFIAFEGTMVAVKAIVTSGVANEAHQPAREKWAGVAILGVYQGFLLATLWFPSTAYVGEFVSDGRVDIPANVARTMILVFGLGLSAWIVALMLRLERYPALARFESLGSGQGRGEIAPGERGDIALLAVAMLAVVVPRMAVMDELTTPFGWPSVQIAVAFLLTLPLIKRRSLDRALMAYRITFVAFALLLVRLAIATPPTVADVERAAIGLAFGAVLTLSVMGYVRTTRLRDVKSSGELPSSVVR